MADPGISTCWMHLTDGNKSCSQSTDCEKEIIEAFSQGDSDTIFSILKRLSSKIQSGLPLFDFRYNDEVL